MPGPEPSTLDETGFVRHLIAAVGGRFSRDVGIDVEAGSHEVDRWFLAATLFGAHISTAIAAATYGVLDEAGIGTVADAARVPRLKLIGLLDAGGYARYDERTATRLLQLARTAGASFPDGLDAWGRACAGSDDLVRGLDALPGWGPVTVHVFLRELRGIWPAADVDPDPRCERAAVHLGIVTEGSFLDARALHLLAERSGVDPRDLEAALVRVALQHGHREPHTRMPCPGGRDCRLVATAHLA